MQGMPEQDDIKAVCRKIPLCAVGRNNSDRRVLSVTPFGLRQCVCVRDSQRTGKMILRPQRIQDIHQQTGSHIHFKDAQYPVLGPVLCQMPDDSRDRRVDALERGILMATLPGDRGIAYLFQQ